MVYFAVTVLELKRSEARTKRVVLHKPLDVVTLAARGRGYFQPAPSSNCRRRKKGDGLVCHAIGDDYN